MATSLIQMAYNMTDMRLIGRVSSNAVAAVGAAGMYLWLANGLAMIPRLRRAGQGRTSWARKTRKELPPTGRPPSTWARCSRSSSPPFCILLNGPLIAFFNPEQPVRHRGCAHLSDYCGGRSRSRF